MSPPSLFLFKSAISGPLKCHTNLRMSFSISAKKTPLGGFPDGPVGKYLPCNAGDAGLIPGQGTKILHATR